MSAPFRIVNQYNETLITLLPKVSIVAAIAVAKGYRSTGIDKRATVHGDSVDPDCPDGLSQAEREAISEAGLR